MICAAYVREDQGKFQMMSAKTDIRRLRQAVGDIGDYVRDVMNLFDSSTARKSSNQ